LRRVNGVPFENRILTRLRRRFNADVYDLVAADFGVPQKRRRLFFLARLKHLGPVPVPPRPTHRRPGVPIGIGIEVGAEPDETPRLEEVLRGPLELPPSTDAEYVLLPDGTALLNASTMRHSQRVIDKIAKIAPGEGPILPVGPGPCPYPGRRPPGYACPSVAGPHDLSPRGRAHPRIR
jgi:DNA (cytosine-5)-methyltransferase 1